jgi:integrase
MPSPSKELLDRLHISRAKYYRLKKANKLDNLLVSVDMEDHFAHLENWINWRDAGLHSKPWAETYRRNLTYQARKYFSHFKAVSSVNLEAWLLQVPPIQHSKRKDRHSAVSSLAKYLRHIDVVSTDELLKILSLYPKKPAAYQPEQRIIYSEDLKALIKSAESARSVHHRVLNTALLVFMSETGLRVSEVAALVYRDLRFSDRPSGSFVRVRNGKGGKSRTVPFSKVAQQALQEYLSYARVHGLDKDKQLFWAHNPLHGFRPLTRDCVARRFKTISGSSRINFSAHSLRHYRITAWANNPRIPITVTQKWAGHSSLEITQRYIHIRDEDALEAAFE